MKDRLLIAISPRKIGVVLAYQGDPMCACTDKDCRTFRGSRAEFEIDHFGEWYLDNHFSDKQLPDKPGVWLWEGEIVYRNYGADDDTDVIWNGEFKPASFADFAHFGITVPLLTTADI